MKSIHLRTRALIAKSVDYGDSDKILTLLTENYGRIVLIARSARRSRRRFGAALDLFIEGEARFSRPRNGKGGMGRLDAFDCVDNFGETMRQDVVRVAHGSYLLELAREFWPEEQGEPRIFDLLVRSLRVLSDHAPSPLLLRAFEIRVMAIFGIFPEIECCIVCGRRVSEDRVAGLSTDKGGVVCSSCPPAEDRLSGEAWTAMNRLQECELELVSGVDVAQSVRRELRNLLIPLVSRALGKRIRSLEFVEELRRAHGSARADSISSPPG